MGDSRGPYTDKNDLHVSVRTISMHHHNIKQFPHEPSPRAQITILTSYHPQHGRSPRAHLILNLMSMHVHNINSIKGMMMHPNQSNIDILHNHLDYHNYTSVIKKTQSHKDFKSIIYHLMPICLAFSNYNPHSIVVIFHFITPVLVPMPVTPFIRDPHLSLLPLCLFSFFNL